MLSADLWSDTFIASPARDYCKHSAPARGATASPRCRRLARAQGRARSAGTALRPPPAPQSPSSGLNKRISVVSGEQTRENFLSVKARCRRTALPSQVTFTDPPAPCRTQSHRATEGRAPHPPALPGVPAFPRGTRLPLSLPRATAELGVSSPAAGGHSEGARGGNTPKAASDGRQALSPHPSALRLGTGSAPHKNCLSQRGGSVSSPGAPSVSTSFSSGETRGGLHPCAPGGRHLTAVSSPSNLYNLPLLK